MWMSMRLTMLAEIAEEGEREETADISMNRLRNAGAVAFTDKTRSATTTTDVSSEV